MNGWTGCRFPTLAAATLATGLLTAMVGACAQAQDSLAVVGQLRLSDTVPRAVFPLPRDARGHVPERLAIAATPVAGTPTANYLLILRTHSAGSASEPREIARAAAYPADEPQRFVIALEKRLRTDDAPAEAQALSLKVSGLQDRGLPEGFAIDITLSAGSKLGEPTAH